MVNKRSMVYYTVVTFVSGIGGELRVSTDTVDWVTASQTCASYGQRLIKDPDLTSLVATLTQKL